MAASTGSPLRTPSPWLALALVLGLTRFVRLGEWSLWIDEVYTLHDWWEMQVSARADWPRNPLGYWLVGQVLSLTGGPPDEWKLRILPAACGFLAIALAAWAFAPLVGSRRAGLAALLLAVSSWHLYWSQNARFYTLAQALGLAGGALVLRGLFAGGGTRSGLRSGALLGSGLLVGLVAALAHPSAILLLPAWIAAALALPWLGAALGREALQRRRLVALLGALGLVAAAPWAYRVGSSYLAAKGAADAASPGAWAAGAAHLVLSSGFFVTPLLGAAALAGAWTGWRRRDPVDLFAFLTCAAFGGFVLLGSLVVKASAQYVFVLLPWIALLATAPFAAPGETRGRSSWNPARVLALFVLVLAPALDCALYLGIRNGDRPQWREAFRYVFDQRGDDDIVFAAFAPVAEYYLAPGARDLRHPLAVAKLDMYEHFYERHWDRQGRRAWFVVNRELLEDWAAGERREFEKMLAGQCRLARFFPVPSAVRDLDLFVYVRDP